MDKIRKRSLFLSISLIVVIVIFFIAALILGRYRITISDFVAALFNKPGYDTVQSVIINLRLPRTIMALFVGMALGVSGLIYQEVFRNKLVSPDFLGVSSGASVGAALAIIIGLSAWFISLFAFIFALIAISLTLLIAKLLNKQSTTILVLSGIVVSSLMSALISIIKFLAPSEAQLASITFWLMGSYASATMSQIYVMLPFIIIPLIVLLVLSWRINIIGQGPTQAESQGLNYRFYLVLVVLVTTLLTATAVAFSGVVGWIGLVVPHIIRLILGKNTKFTIVNTMLLGGIFSILADILLRTFTGSEMPLTAVTGLIGTIVFIITLYINRRKTNDYT